jgi:hypothetical protein
MMLTVVYTACHEMELEHEFTKQSLIRNIIKMHYKKPWAYCFRRWVASMLLTVSNLDYPFQKLSNYI